MSGTSYLVSGARLAAYTEQGISPPAGHMILRCITCQTPIVLSAEGGQRLQAAIDSGNHRMAGGICPRCLNVLAYASKVVGVETTKTGADLIEQSDEAKAVLSTLIENASQAEMPKRPSPWHRKIASTKPIPDTRAGQLLTLECGHQAMAFGDLDLEPSGMVFCQQCQINAGSPG